jgi:hypothetical protein
MVGGLDCAGTEVTCAARTAALHKLSQIFRAAIPPRTPSSLSSAILKQQARRINEKNCDLSSPLQVTNDSRFG